MLSPTLLSLIIASGLFITVIGVAVAIFYALLNLLGVSDEVSDAQRTNITEAMSCFPPCC